MYFEYEYNTTTTNNNNNRIMYNDLFIFNALLYLFVIYNLTLIELFLMDSMPHGQEN